MHNANPLGKYQKPSANSKLYKKSHKKYIIQEKILLRSLPVNSEVLARMSRELRQEVMFVFLHICVVQHIKKNLELQVVLLMEDEVRDDSEM